VPDRQSRLRELSGASRGGPPSRHPQRDTFADCNSLYPQITAKIIAELEHSRVPWVQPWGNVKAPLL
jgi:antirestriction protein ArdC